MTSADDVGGECDPTLVDRVVEGCGSMNSDEREGEKAEAHSQDRDGGNICVFPQTGVTSQDQPV